MKKTLLTIALSALVLGSCGKDADPFNITKDVESLPELGLPVTASLIAIQSDGTFTNTSGKLRFTLVGFGSSTSIYTPGAGVVKTISTESDGVAVAIYHNGLLSSKVYEMESASVSVGQMVTSGQVIGTRSNAGNRIGFAVLLNGKPVCPIPFLNSSDRTRVNSFWSGTIQVCQ